MLLLLLSVTVSASNLHLRMDMFNGSVYHNKIFVTTDDGGLISFDPEDSSWNWVNSISGLPSNETKDIFLYGDSLFVLSKGGITIFDEDLNLINSQDFNPIFFTDTNPTCIYVHEDNVILGGESGIQWFGLRTFGSLSREVEHEDYNFEVLEILSLDTCYLLGTSRGVFRADTNFEDTTIIDAFGRIYSLFVSDSSIWAGSSWSCKEILSNTWIFSGGLVWTIGKIDEDIYIGTRVGLYKYNGDILETIHGGDVRGFAQVTPQNLRVSVVRENGLLFEGTSSYIYPPGLASNMVADLAQTPDGKIFVSHRGETKDTNKRSVSVFDGNGWQVPNISGNWPFPGKGFPFNIESDSQGRIYFGFWYWNDRDRDSILCCLDTRNDTIPEIIELPIPSATTVTGMLVDSNDDLWLGLLYGGSCVLKMHRVAEDSLEWTTYIDPGMVWKRVFAEGMGGMYCGNSPTDGGPGIHLLGVNEDDIETVVGDLGSSTISMCSDLEGNVWAGLEDKLVYISGNSVERVEISEKFEGLAVDFQGGLWCYNTTEGLSYLNPEGNWESLPQELRGIQPFTLNDIISPLHFIGNQKLFVCTYNGLYEFDLNFNLLDSGRVSVYPNPFNYARHNRLNFSANDLGGKDVFIYDIIGEMKGEYEVPSESNVLSIDVDLSSGLYMFFVAEEGRIIYKGKFVVVR